MLGQKGQDIELLLHQGDLLLPLPDGAVGVVDDQIPVETDTGRLRPPLIPAEMCLHLGQKHLNGEGLDDVLISPGSKALDLVGVLHPGGEEQNRAGHVLPDPAAHLQAVHVRHIHIQQNQVRLPSRQGHGLLPAASRQHLIAPTAKAAGQHVPDVLLIIYDQQRGWHKQSSFLTISPAPQASPPALVRRWSDRSCGKPKCPRR